MPGRTHRRRTVDRRGSKQGVLFYLVLLRSVCCQCFHCTTWSDPFEVDFPLLGGDPPSLNGKSFGHDVYLNALGLHALRRVDRLSIKPGVGLCRPGSRGSRILSYIGASIKIRPTGLGGRLKSGHTGTAQNRSKRLTETRAYLPLCLGGDFARS